MLCLKRCSIRERNIVFYGILSHLLIIDLASPEKVKESCGYKENFAMSRRNLYNCNTSTKKKYLKLFSIEPFRVLNVYPELAMYQKHVILSKINFVVWQCG